jgi:two-component system alkaline phosphatase synthesis response regulator PhoP
MKKIWIVDDDEEMARAVTLMLKLLGCETRHFLTARLAAKSILDGQRPDLLILDVNMPEVNGVMMLEFVRKRADVKNLPIIMLSSEAADLQVDIAIQKGADAYITKPVSLDELEAAMKSAFQKHNQL